MIKGLFFFFIFYFSTVYASGITLLQLHQLALKNNFDLLRSEYDKAKKEEDVDKTLQKYLPSIQLLSSGTRKELTNAATSDLSLRFNYKFNFSIPNELEDHENDLELIEETRQQAIKNLLFTVSTQYLKASSIQTNIKNTVAQKQWLKQKLERALAVNYLGSGNKTNVHRLKLQINHIESQLQTTYTNYFNILGELSEISGEKIENTKLLNTKKTNSLLERPLVLSTLFRNTLDNDLTIKKIKNKINKINLTLDALVYNQLPNVSVFAGLNKGFEGDTFLSLKETKDDFQYGWNLSWNIFDQGANTIEAKKLQMDQQKLEIDLLQQQQMLRKKIFQLQKDIELSIVKTKHLIDAFYESERIVEIYEQKYQLESENIESILEAKETSSNLQIQYVNSLVNVLLKQLELLYTAGTISEKDIVLLDNWIDEPNKIIAENDPFNPRVQNTVKEKTPKNKLLFKRDPIIKKALGKQPPVVIKQPVASKNVKHVNVQDLGFEQTMEFVRQQKALWINALSQSALQPEIQQPENLKNKPIPKNTSPITTPTKGAEIFINQFPSSSKPKTIN